jgi:putative aldouronate transport system substrate-binding protein
MLKKNTSSIVIVILILIIMGMMYQIQMGSVKNSGREIASIYEEEKAEEKPVTLKMVVIGEAYPDGAKVMEEVNRLLEETIGVHLEVRYIHPKEMALTYPRLFAGGADFDMIQVLPMGYSDYVSKKAYMNLTEDMIIKTMPKTFEEMGDGLLKTLEVKERLYMIPSTGFLNNHKVLVLRGDLLGEVGFTQIMTIEDLEIYLKGVMNQELHLVPLDFGGDALLALEMFYLQEKEKVLYDDYLMYLDQNKIGVKWLLEDTGLDDYRMRMEQWKKLGLIKGDSYLRSQSEEILLIKGEVAAIITSVYRAENLVRYLHLEKPEYAPQIVTLNQKASFFTQASQMGIAIKNGSVNAAKSLEFIELLRYDEKLFRLLNYGVLDDHYAINGNGEYIPLTNSVRYPIYNIPVWFMSNEFALGYRFRINGIAPFATENPYEIKTVQDYNPKAHDLYKKKTQTLLFPALTGEPQSMNLLRTYKDELMEEDFGIYMEQLTADD